MIGVSNERTTPALEEGKEGTSTNNEDKEHEKLLGADDDIDLKTCKIKSLPFITKQDPTSRGNASGIKNDANVDNSGNVSNEKDSEEITNNARLQDCGWAWMIAFGCFLSHFILGGFDRSEGVMFVWFTNKFGKSAQITSLPGALCATLTLLLGPVASAVSNRFSARTSVMLGTMLVVGGLITSGFAQSVSDLIASYGILQGLGQGLVFAPVIITVGLYFNRLRSFGVGLGTSGVGLGTFVFPPLVDVLLEHYGFQGTFLIMGGLALNLFVTGALFRPLSMHRNIVLGIRKISPGQNGALQTSLDVKERTRTLPNTLSIEGRQPSSNDCKRTLANADSAKNGFKYTVPLVKQTGIFGFIMSILATCCPVDNAKEDAPEQRLIEWSLMKNTPFLLFCLSSLLFSAALKSVNMFLPSLANASGITLFESASLISVSGILDTIGRVLSGVILDLKCIKPFRPIVYNGVVFVIAILSFLAPFLTSFVEFAFFFGLYGMLIGVYMSQKSVVLVDILGQEKLRSSFGLTIGIQGLGILIGPPVSGFLRDIHGRFDEAFYLNGVFIAIAGCCLVITNICLINMRHKSV